MFLLRSTRHSSSHPDSIPHEVPQVLINREQLPHLNFDVELLGDCDVIVNELCHRLGGDFEQLCYNIVRLSETTEKPPRLPEPPPSEASPAAAQEEERRLITDSVTPPPEETESLNDAAGSDAAPPEPCPDARCPSEETAEPAELPAEDAPPREEEEEEEEEGTADVKSQTSNLELRRRCWMSRINRSPISKRLESKSESSDVIRRWIQPVARHSHQSSKFLLLMQLLKPRHPNVWF